MSKERRVLVKRPRDNNGVTGNYRVFDAEGGAVGNGCLDGVFDMDVDSAGGEVVYYDGQWKEVARVKVEPVEVEAEDTEKDPEKSEKDESQNEESDKGKDESKEVKDKEGDDSEEVKEEDVKKPFLPPAGNHLKRNKK